MKMLRVQIPSPSNIELLNNNKNNNNSWLSQSMCLFGKISLSIIIKNKILKNIFKATKLNKLKYIVLSPSLVLCELIKSINNFNQFPKNIYILPKLLS